MANTVKLEFAGDADKLAKEARRAEQSMAGFGAGADDASAAADRAGAASEAYTDRLGKLGAGMDGVSNGFMNAADGLQAFADLQSAGAERASRLARAAADVAQAQEDMAQATRDANQAQIDGQQAIVDEEQARLDQATALRDYNEAVKEHGKGSLEAQQAQIDLKQAGIDVKQAQEDAAQAVRDGAQASIDARTAQLDLNDAQREANPPDLQNWADQLNMLAPLLSGVTAVVGLVTAAQWAWNSSLLASPVTWIVLGIAAVVAAIVLLVKHWDKVKAAGAAAWDWIKKAASNSWDFIKKIPGWLGSAFKGIAKVISWPYRQAFNLISDAWNNTIGKLSWTVPGWIPGIGGNTISVPHLPRFHTGGTVPGPAGQEVMAILQGGEEIRTGRGDDSGGWVVIRGDAVLDDLIAAIANRVGKKGGRAAQLGIRVV